VRVSAVERAGLQNLNEGQKISFDVIAIERVASPRLKILRVVWFGLPACCEPSGHAPRTHLPSPRAEALLTANSFERTPTGFV
jgi:hypothetical protein